ncbi:MAG: aldo/keto reductase [Muribaculaceae bacterium]|nr:aldo/keto reductase [Muribaculaceae bacterium]
MIETLKLSNGVDIPCMGYGTYKITERSSGVRVVKDALAAGYRLLDTAAMYQNEQEVGEAVVESGITRKDIFVTSKVANPDRGYDSTLRAFDYSLRNLQMDYLDLYLIHWPADKARFGEWKKINSDTWRALERLLYEGRVKSIGVSNFMTEHLEALAETARVLPMVNQIEFHPGWMQPEVLEWCRRRNVVVEGWSPLGRTRVLENPLLGEVARRYGKSVARICLRWAVQHGVVPLPKSVSPERMRSNLDIFDFSLSEADMHLIDSMPPTGESGLTPDSIDF